MRTVHRLYIMHCRRGPWLRKRTEIGAVRWRYVSTNENLKLINSVSCPRCLAHCPFHLHSQQSHHSSLCFCHPSSWLWHSHLPLSLTRTLVITLGHPNHPRQSPHPKVLNLISSAKSLFPCKITFTQVPGIRMWISLGNYYSTYHPGPISFQPCFTWRNNPMSLKVSSSV